MDKADWKLQEVACDYCGSQEADVLLRGRDRAYGLPGEFNVVVCRRCGLARTNPQPTPESLGLAYPKDYKPHGGGKRVDSPRGLLRWALVNLRGYPIGRRSSAVARGLGWPLAAAALTGRKVLGYLPYEGSGRLLDFGCGTGGYVAKMTVAGWKAAGIDVSHRAVLAGREAGLTILEGTLPGVALPDESFDVVTMWQALEHVPSPRATLAAAWRLLAPGGRLVVALPRLDSLEARWFGSRWFPLELPRHLTHFTAATLRRHIEATGFRVERIRPVRLPTAIRHSFDYAADERPAAFRRYLARSRLIPSLMSWTALAAGRSSQMVCLARRIEETRP